MVIADRIKNIIQESGLSLPAFAKRIRVSKNTLINYRDGASYPNSESLSKICEEFLINPQWLLLGTGPMKAEQSLYDARLDLAADYAEGDIRKTAAAMQRPPGRKAQPPTPQDQGEVMLQDPSLDLKPEPSQTIESRGFKMSEMLSMTARVLESGTTYAVALAYNIQHFDRAVTAESRIDKLQQSIQSQGQTISNQAGIIHRLEDECISVRKEVEELKSQLVRLLATGGDDPDHSEEVA